MLVREANDEIGGAVRSMELTLPGFVHDPFSAVYPMAAASPYLSRLPLLDHGLEWVRSPFALAHPFDDGSAAVLDQSIDETVRRMGPEGDRYRELMGLFAARWPELSSDILGPLGIPRHPLLMARFGLRAIRSALSFSTGAGESRTAALLSGSAAHAGLPLETLGSAAFGLTLHAAGHRAGWPFPRGGAGRLSAAMASLLRSLGGTIETGAPVSELRELPPARLVLLDLTPAQLIRIGAESFPDRYLRRLRRFRYGVGVFKMDWALTGPIPWRAGECAGAATIHLGGGQSEIAASMRAPAGSQPAERPFVIFAQPSLFDSTRAPAGMHTAWAYCHIPNGSPWDMSAAIEAQVERFAPGFRDLIAARSILTPARLEALNGNLVGGDVNGGSPALPQLLFRPMITARPYDTPVRNLFICSASTPPGGGVHGMCGFHAARRALGSIGVPPVPLA